MITAFERRAMQLREPFRIDFSWNGSRAYTVGYQDYNRLFEREEKAQAADEKSGRTRKNRYLIIDSICQIEAYDRVSEVTAIARPNILVLLGIICFVTGQPLTTFGFHSVFSTVAGPDTKHPRRRVRLEIEGDDYSASLEELLAAMSAIPEAKLPLVYSLLDRWRKASYLEQENEESYLYEDEAILACFHILELLGGEYGPALEAELDEKVAAFSEDVLVHTFSIVNVEERNKFVKLLNATLDEHKVKLKPKILRMFRELGLLEPKSQALIDRFLNHRNAIAHGRVNLYENKAIFPLKPFFTHMKDIYEDINTIRIVSARAIAAYLGTFLWSDEWDEMIENEPTVWEQVQEFNRTESYAALTWQQLENGAEQGISVGLLIHYYRKGQLKFIPFTRALARYIREVELTPANDRLLLYSAAILADSTDAQLAVRAQQLLTQLKDSDLEARFDMRDVLKELAYQGKEPRWLKAFLIERAS